MVGPLTVAALVVGFAAGGAEIAASPSASVGDHPPGASAVRAALPARTALLVLENRSYHQVIGNRRAPFLNALARRGAVATRYYALGHPSLPNYLALTTGSTWGLTTNCRACRFDHPSLFGQFDRAHVSWRAYFQTLPSRKLAVSRTATYNPHYNPFAYLSDIRGSRADRARIGGFTALSRALRRRRLPSFSWIAPDMFFDGHSRSLRRADRYLTRLVPRVLAALGPQGLLYITWDEGRRADRSGPGGGHVALIAVGPRARSGARVPRLATHLALLRTIEHSYRLHSLVHALSPADRPLLGVLRRNPT
jgi:hypothetical protein